MNERKFLRLAIPNGSLQQSTVDLFCRAGYNMRVDGRSYRPAIADDEIECLLVRPQEQPRYIQDGLMDVGITGVDLIQEAGAKVIEVMDMIYSKVSRRPTRWVVAVPNDSPIRDVRDLSGKRIATELVNVTRAFLDTHGVKALVEYSYGATESKPGLLADAIVDATETGNSLRANGLRIVATVAESTPRLIASPAAWNDEWKRQKIEDVALMLKGAIAAEGKVWLSMNAKRSDLESVLAILPALDTPTVASLSDHRR
jgi:ATP phosphoribosyltransferase